MAKKPLLSPETLRQILRYEPETGRLFWRYRQMVFDSGEKGRKVFNTKYAGKEAFTTIDANGYRVGHILGRCYYAHRVIIAMTSGHWPIAVDHDNRQTGDNRLINISAVSRAKNQRNMKLNSRNKSGVGGVSFCGERKKWAASIRDGSGRNKHLGRFLLFEDAVAARRAAEEIYGYHRNHGKA